MALFESIFSYEEREMKDHIMHSIERIGVIPYFRQSLELAIIDHHLYLLSGAAVDFSGNYLDLQKNAHRVLEDMSVTNFENHSTYYFYLSQKVSQKHPRHKNMLKYCELENNMIFFISSEKEDAVMLGEVRIDYDAVNAKGGSMIRTPLNAFAPSANEIDMRNIPRTLPYREVSSMAEKEIFTVLLRDLSSAMQEKMRESNEIAWSPLAAVCFLFASEIKYGNLTHYQLYQKYMDLTTLFEEIPREGLNTKCILYLADLKRLVTEDRRQYKVSFYQFENEREGDFYYRVFELLRVLVAVLLSKKAPDINLDQEKLQSAVTLEGLPSDMLISEGEDQEEYATLLLNVDSPLMGVQVGRGSESGNDIILCEKDKTVSRIHLRITPYKEGFFLEDLSSMGTYIDSIKMEKHTKKYVTGEEKIQLGKKGCMLDLYHPMIQNLSKHEEA